MKIDFNSFRRRWTRPKTTQFPVGSRVYKGFQGSGKTLSMVKYAFDVQKKYPDCIIYSNIHIDGLNNYHYIEDDSVLIEALQCRNGSKGVLVLLDEAHLYFNKKTGISLDVLTAISQQRKDRKRLVFSSQIWEELDISLRKQVKEIVSCRCFFKCIQFNTISDGETLAWDKVNSCYVAHKLCTEIFKHYDVLYNCYNTLQKIVTNDDYSRSFTPSPVSSTINLNMKNNRVFRARQMYTKQDIFVISFILWHYHLISTPCFFDFLYKLIRL